MQVRNGTRLRVVPGGTSPSVCSPCIPFFLVWRAPSPIVVLFLVYAARPARCNMKRTQVLLCRIIFRQFVFELWTLMALQAFT